MNPYVTPEFDVSQLRYNYTWPKREAIHVACGEGKLDVVKTLVEVKGIDVSARDNHGNTPMFYAMRGGRYDIVKYLLDSGVSVNSAPNYNFTSLLHLAAECGEGKICNYLISKGASVNACNPCGHTPLFFAAFRGSDVTARALIDAGAEVNIPENYPQYATPPFLIATKQGHLKLMKLLISFGAEPEEADRDGMTPLHHAVFDGLVDVVRVLVADINVSMEIRNLNKETPLMLAVRVKNLDIINLLISAGYNLSQERSIFDKDSIGKIADNSRRDIMNYLRHVACQPRSLQALCCFRVRDVLRWTVQTGNSGVAIDTLSVPFRLREFIKLSHL